MNLLPHFRRAAANESFMSVSLSKHGQRFAAHFSADPTARQAPDTAMQVLIIPTTEAKSRSLLRLLVYHNTMLPARDGWEKSVLSLPFFTVSVPV